MSAAPSPAAPDPIEWVKRFLAGVEERVPSGFPPILRIVDGRLFVYVLPDGADRWASFTFDEGEGVDAPEVVAASVAKYVLEPAVRADIGLPPLASGARECACCAAKAEAAGHIGYICDCPAPAPEGAGS